jgi:PAS domain S-box-containing protein
MSSSVRPDAEAAKDRHLKPLLSYAAAIVAVSASLALRTALSKVLGPNLPVFLFFCPAVIVVAFLAGTGPGLVATAAADLELAFWVYPARHLSVDQLTGLVLFCAAGILASLFSGFFRKAQQRSASKMQESALKTGESHFLTMFHLSPISMSLIRMSNSTCYDVNQAHVDLFGFSRDEAVGHAGQDLNLWVNLNDREKVLKTLSQQQRVSNYEADLRRKQGDIVTTLLSAEVVRLDGEPFLWMMHNDITERRKIERALRESEESLRLVFEGIQEAFIVQEVMTDSTGRPNDLRFLMVNPAAEKQLGRTQRELVGQPQSIIQGPLDSEVIDVIGRVLRDDTPFAFERHDPQLGRWFAVTVYSPRPGQIATLSRDITEIKEADIALRTLVDAIPGMVLLMNTEGVVLAANETIANRIGMSTSEMVGRNAYDRLPPEVMKSRKSYAEEALRWGEPRHWEDNRAGRHFDNYVHPIKDGKGSVTRLAILSLDITERKSAEAKLKEQAALLDIASDAILVKNLDGRIVYWNKGAERLYGWSADEAMGESTFELLYGEEHVSEGREALEEVLEKGEWRGELHQKAKDDTSIIVEARWTLIRDDKGEPNGILAVKTDITAKRSIEAQLLRSQRLESLGTLAGGIAHDLNNVLAPILMGIEGLSFHDPNDSVRKILSIIKTSAQRGANIVRQILNFARGMEGDIGEIQVRHVLREVEQIIEETFPKSIELKAGFAKDLWPVSGDATQLHQVLMNLCINARDAMPDGGVLTLSAENVSLDETYAKMNVEARPITYVMLKVDDTGSGMPPGILEKIFDPFFTTKEPGKGTGLGLSTVRTIVKNHGGFVTVDSEPGKGTSFRVYIPVSEQGVQPKESGPEQGIPMGDGESILVVDDEASLRDMTRQVLESCGYRVTTAANGTEAVARFAERKADFQLVVTDMMMPYMDGPATIRAIRKIDPRARFIVTSGSMVDEHAREAEKLGVQAFLSKPYTAEELLRTLRQALEKKT